MILFAGAVRIARIRLGLASLILAVLCAGCRPTNPNAGATVQMTRVPAASLGGPEHMDSIAGTVRGARAGQHIVIYTHSASVWWIQPLTNKPFTMIEADSTWKNTIHLGTEYAALLVEPSYLPEVKLESLPEVGKGVLAVAVARGAGQPAAPREIDFSGFKWTVLGIGSLRGGALNSYDPANAWTDQKGYLHLQIAQHDGKRTSAEVSLTRSLGYGTYRFVVEDSSQLSPDTMLEMYTWDEVRSSDSQDEVDIELGRWGIPQRENAAFTVQPYYVPENVALFNAPPGVLTHTLLWQAGRASFKTVRGSSATSSGGTIAEHTFTSDIPTPAGETIHIILFDCQRCKGCPPKRPEEVVIEKFEYLP